MRRHSAPAQCVRLEDEELPAPICAVAKGLIPSFTLLGGSGHIATLEGQHGMGKRLFRIMPITTRQEYDAEDWDRVQESAGPRVVSYGFVPPPPPEVPPLPFTLQVTIVVLPDARHPISSRIMVR